MSKILIIDDDELLVGLIESELSALGYEVFTAANGLDGLQTASQFRPHLILLDIVMPALDGNEVLRALKSHPDLARIPIIMMTARRKTDDVIGAARIGADDYLVKPIDMGDLKVRIERVLKKGPPWLV